jgi:hypothetical protein
MFKIGGIKELEKLIMKGKFLLGFYCNDLDECHELHLTDFFDLF